MIWSNKILIYILIVFMIGCKAKNETVKNKDKIFQKEKKQIAIEDMYAWCIIPHDSLKRSPQERIDMLKELGIKSYAYDWRDDSLDQMEEEIVLARNNNLEIKAIWMSMDDASDKVSELRENNERVFKIIETTKYSGQIWLGFDSKYFKNLSNEEALKKSVEMVGYLSKRAKALNCKIALYSHGGWLGEPENQIKVIKYLPNDNIGIIFNYHHYENQIDELPEIVDMILPYVWSVNLNGVIPNGSRINPLGTGTQELIMTQTFLDKGYTGSFGILGHVRTDIKPILQANILGLKKLNSMLK